MRKLFSYIKDAVIRRTLSYYLLFICLGLSIGITGPTLPRLAEQTHSTIGQMGWLFLASSIGYILGTIIGGRIFDRFPGHPLMGIAQLGSAVMIALLPVAPWLWLLLCLAVLKGIADGIVNTGANILLLWTHKEKVGPFMNGLHFSFGLGAFLSPLLVAQVATTVDGYRWIYWLLASVSFMAGFVILFLPDSPNPQKHVQEHYSQSINIKGYYPFIITAMLYLFFYVGSEITYGGWIYTYAFTLNLASAVNAAYLNSAFWFSFTVGRLISIPLAVRFKPQQMIATAIAGCLVTLAFILVIPRSNLVLWLVTLGVGFCMAPLWPSGYTLAGQSLKLSATASSIILLGDSFGGMILPWLVGQIIDTSGPRAMVFVVFISIVGTLIAFSVMLRLRPVKSTL